MNRRQRFLQTMTFGSPDRPAAGDYFAYESTRARWEREGLPPGADLDDYFACDFDPFLWRVPATLPIFPLFKERVVAESGNTRVIRTAGGDTVRVLKDAPPPAMPQWVRYPLSSRSDWRRFRRRLDPAAPGRLPPDFPARATELADRDYPLGLWLGSSYGYLRDWWGLESLSRLFYDDPGLIEEMVEYLTRLSVGLLDRVLRVGVELDWVMFWEDMACNHGPLVSPELYARFCSPFYTAVMERVRRAQIPVVMLDSDGDVRKLVPFWLDMGIHVMHPMEVAAGMDVREARRIHGKDIGFFGGIGKRALAGTREDIRREVVPKLDECLGEGGFIPACDHGIPPDVSFDNYRCFRDLVREASERGRHA
jgi:hypothetical protein